MGVTTGLPVEVDTLPHTVYVVQVVTELCKAVPPDHRAEINEQETKRPGNFVTYQVLQFNKPPVKIHALLQLRL